MAILTNSKVQSTLIAAEDYLTEQVQHKSALDCAKMSYLLQLIHVVRVYSASGNSTPGYGGLGLQEIYELAEAVLKTKPTSDHQINIHSYKAAGSSISLSE